MERRNRHDVNADNSRSSGNNSPSNSRNHEPVIEYERRRIDKKNSTNIDNRIIDFQKRSKYVQDRLVQKRQELNDKEEQKCLKDSPKKHVEHEQNIRDRTASNSPNTSSKNANDSTKLQEDNRRLECQVNVLIDIINQLVLNSPKLQDRVRQIAIRNPTVIVLPLLNISADNNEKPSCSPNTGRVRREREILEQNNRVRNSSSISERSETTNKTNNNQVNNNNIRASNDVACAKKTRNNERRKKNKKAENKTEKTELHALVNYINTIVAEYLGDQKTELIEKLKFKGTSDDLSAYADTLVQAGLGRIVEEELRVNRKNNRQSFISMSNDREGLERDGIILLPVARRYAFESDIVRAFVMNAGVSNTTNQTIDYDKKKSISSDKDNSFCLEDDDTIYMNDDDVESDMENSEIDTSAIVISDNCPKSFVIKIIQTTPDRQIVGIISFKNSIILNDDKNYYKLKPHDMRMPMLYIPSESCAEHIGAADDDICGLLFLAEVIETNLDGYCIGKLLQPVGKVGNLKAEIKAILFQNGLDNLKPYDQRFIDQFNDTQLPTIPMDVSYREDLRKKCIFTIDPLTARDLDDAMSVDRLQDDEVEIGVHISDVSHYLHENTELDNIVQKRATSIYLVNEVIHMLPESLCLKCSLLPDCDKYAFSVFWRMNMNGDVIGEPRFTRSIIKSCTQFAYEHAQKIIDHPTENFDADDFPDIYNSFTTTDVSTRILILHAIAQKLRAKRYDDGALSINNPKMHFELDGVNGEPISFGIDDRQEANFLIEEFMLLANQSVARFIYNNFPTISILRNHAPPLTKSMKAIREKLAALGLNFDYSSSKSVFESMTRICAEAEDMKAMDACLNTLLTKPMARAKYICSEGIARDQDLWHYALSIPIYTHFTSPIRRYPDILVHRLLAAALNYEPAPNRTPDELHVIAKICNDQKFNAKSAGDDCSNLFFKRFIKSKQAFQLRAAIVEIYQHLVNVVTIDTGHALSIHYKMQKVVVDASNVPTCIYISEKNSKLSPLKLKLFSTVDIKLVIWDDKICAFFASPDAKQRQLNCIESSKKKQEKNKNMKTSPSTDESKLQTSNNSSNFKLKKQKY